MAKHHALSVLRIVRKNSSVDRKIYRESTELLKQLADLGISNGADYDLASPYGGRGLQKREPNVLREERRLRFDRQ